LRWKKKEKGKGSHRIGSDLRVFSPGVRVGRKKKGGFSFFVEWRGKGKKEGCQKFCLRQLLGKKKRGEKIYLTVEEGGGGTERPYHKKKEEIYGGKRVYSGGRGEKESHALHILNPLDRRKGKGRGPLFLL